MTSLGAMIRRDIPPAEVIDHAVAVQDGFDELWVVEDLPYAGGISQAGAVLAATTDVMVGHGIAPAPFRNPAALAMEWAALAEMFPGRVAAGIGHGVTRWMAQIGERVDSPLTLLDETMSVVHRLLAGERVSFDGRYVTLDNVELVYRPAVAPRVSAGVAGPNSLKLAGRVAGGTILPEGHGPAEVAVAKANIEAGRRAASRTDDHRLTVFAGFHCGDPNDMAEPNPDATTGWDAVAEDPQAVASQLQSLIDAGVDAVILVPFGRDAAAQLRLAASEVIGLLTR